MKKLIFLLLLLPCLLDAQEVTIENLGITSETIDEMYCSGDTITTLFFQITKTTTDNGTAFPNVAIDTTIFQSGNCPADSLEVLRQIERDAVEIQNRTAHTMNLAFQRARRDQTTYAGVRTIYNNFTGSDLYMANESKYWNQYEGVYRIINVQTGSSVLASMVRVGVDERYRLEINEGETGAGTRYTIVPFNVKSFQINQYNGSNYKMYRDDGVDNRNPIFRHSGYIEGGTKDVVRIVKIQ